MNETADHMGDLKRKVRNFLNGISGGSSRIPPAAPLSDSHSQPEISSVLRAARVQAGLELRDVAAMLKIRHVFMLAIEDGRYHELPGKAYAVGFVRAYADYLGLDCDAVVLRFKDEVASKVSQPNLYFPTPVPEGRVPGGTILLFSVVLACLVYGSWYVLSATDRSMVDMVPALPQRLVSLLEGFHSDSGTVTGAGASATPSAPAASTAGAPPAPVAPSPSAVSLTGSEFAPPPAAGVMIKPATPGDAQAGPTVTPGSIGGQGAAPTLGLASTPGSAPPFGAAPASASGAAPYPTAAAPDANADSGDEIPLVSGPADETVGEPGPLVPMAPRTKPAPPGTTPAVTAPPTSPTAVPNPADAAAAAGAVGTGAAGLPPPSPAAALPTGRVYGAQNRESRVQIRATQDAWVQIRNADGDPVFTRVLHPGDVFRIPGRQGMRLRTGNAGGLEAIVDGGAPHPLGQVGQVLRDAPIEAGPVSPGDTTGD